MQRKSKKRLILAGAARFNSKPKTGLAFLEENGLIYHDLSDEITRSQSLAKFLKSSTRLDKKLLGDFISKPENIDVLKAFVGLFDFREVRSLAGFMCRMTFNRWPFTEAHCRRNERALGNVSTSRGGSANCANHRDIC
jgi:Sec7 domain